MPVSSSNASSNTSTATTPTSSVATSQKPKLTGWAQAAARAIPKQQQKDQAQTKNPSTSTDTPQFAKNPTTSAAVSNSSNNNDPNTTSTSSTATNIPAVTAHDVASSRHSSNRDSMSANTPTNKRPQRQPYNREEVKTYMNKLFEKYSSEPTLRSYREIFENRNNLSGADGSDWGVVTGRGGRHRNRKYGCLAEVAKVLKN